jgi:protein-S-isoprenylcysteine O-methyltransferase Ste14
MYKFKRRFLTFPIEIQAVVLILSAILVFGLIGPSMISSNSTFAVWIGLLLCIAEGLFLWHFSEDIRNKLGINK